MSPRSGRQIVDRQVVVIRLASSWVPTESDCGAAASGRKRPWVARAGVWKGEHATGEREPYEWNDPDELENVAAITAPAVLPSPSARLALLCACAGPTCRALALREG